MRILKIRARDPPATPILGFRVLGVWDEGLGFRDYGLEFKDWGLGFRGSGLGFRHWALRSFPS